MTFIFDTGSKECWAPISTCPVLQCTKTLYAHTLSATYGTGVTAGTLNYMTTTATGTYSSDRTCLANNAVCTGVSWQFLAVTSSTNYATNMQASGVCGLAPLTSNMGTKQLVT